MILISQFVQEALNVTNPQSDASHHTGCRHETLNEIFDASHLHFDVRYLLEAKKGAEEIIVSKESKDVAWIKQNEVLKLNNEYSIKRMLNKGMHFKKSR